MNRHITNRMFLCDRCGRPIDPVRHDWMVDEDGCNVCAECFALQQDAAAEADEAEWLCVVTDIQSLASWKETEGWFEDA